MKKNIVRLLLPTLFLCSMPLYGAFAEECRPLENASGTLENTEFSLTYRTEPSTISVSEPFSLHVQVCQKNKKTYSHSFNLDATMPKHRHGMNFSPKITEQASGKFLIEGMLLHMPGEWQYKFDLKRDGEKRQLVKDFLLK